MAAYIIAGWPGQTESEITHAIDFVHRLGVQARIAEFTPIPHTREGKAMTRICPADEEEDPLLHNKSCYARSSFIDSLEVVARFKQRAREGNRRLSACL